MGQLYEFEAIGTHWWLERLDGDEFNDVTRKALADYTSLFDQHYSRFRDDSLVTELARNGELHNPPQELLDMLGFANELSEVSDGSFSLLVGNALQSLGYGKSVRERTVLSQTEWDNVVWDTETVRVPRGTVLDFGGLGKGWLIDEYVKILREHGVKQYIVNGGGDLYVEADEPISFALEHPYDPSLKIGDIRIKKGSLAASSIVKRAWKQGNERLHHIIDPITGKPSDSDVVATFVCAHTALVADSLATALLVRPTLRDVLEARYNAETLLVTKSQLS